MSKEPEPSPAASTPRASGASSSSSQASSPTPPNRDASETVTREQLAADLRRTMSDARAYLEQLGSEGKERARVHANQPQNQMQEWCEHCEDAIRRKPLASVGIALAVGFVIGKLRD